MQERLLQMGKWLKNNGEAIYGTRKWKKPVQWSKGNRDYKPEGMLVDGELVLKQTVDPEPGYAVKEMFFTQKNGSLYVILPKWPDNKILIKDLNAAKGAQISFLSKKGVLEWTNRGVDLEIKIPEKCTYNFTTEDNYAYVIKISKIK